MANKYLARDDAPFDEKLWAILDNAMIEAAKSQLSARRLLPLEGPYGLGLKAISLADREIEPGISVSDTLPLVSLRQSFTLSIRDLAAYEREGVDLGTTPVVQAAIACAKQEDQLLLHGTRGIPGLLTAKGSHKLTLSDWSTVGTAADDLIKAMSILDEAGFHGPYALGLAPTRYNLLFRRYPQGPATEIEHIRTFITGGVVKVPALKEGGVLLAVGKAFSSIVLGQDMNIGFVGPSGEGTLEFYITESLALYLRQPASICILEG